MEQRASSTRRGAAALALMAVMASSGGCKLTGSGSGAGGSGTTSTGGGTTTGSTTSAGSGGAGGASSTTATTGSAGGGGHGGVGGATSTTGTTGSGGTSGGGGVGGMGGGTSTTGAGGGIIGAPGGDILWTRVFPMKNQQNQAPDSMEPDSLTGEAGGMIMLAGRLKGELKFDAVQSLSTKVPPFYQMSCVIQLDGSTGDHLWSAVYGPTDGTPDTNSVQATIDGAGTVVAGTSNKDFDHYHSYLQKFGAAPWPKTIGNSNMDLFVRGLKADVAGNVRAAFYNSGVQASYDYGGGPIDGLVLVGYSPTGQHLFSKFMYLNPDTVVEGDDAGNIYATGGTTNTLAKFDPSGNVIWSKAFASLPDVITLYTHVLPSGGLWAHTRFQGTLDFGGGPLVSSGAGTALAVARLDSNGNPIWTKLFQSPDFVAGWTRSAGSAAGVVLMGSFTGTIDFGGGPISNAKYIVAFDASGAFNWQKVLPNQVWPLALFSTWRIAIDPSGSVIVASSSKTLDLGAGPPLANQKGIFFSKLSP